MMPEPTSSIATTAGIAAIISTAGAWVVKVLVGREFARIDADKAAIDKRLERHDERIRETERKCVTRDDMDKLADRLTATITSQLMPIHQNITAIHARIDKMREDKD